MLQPEVRCVEFVEQVSDWMDGGLTDDERLLLEEHLNICPHCTRYLDQMRAALAVLRDASDAYADSRSEAVPAAMRATLLTALRRERS